MLRKVVVVVPPSPSKETKCPHCGSFTSRSNPICAKCQALIPLDLAREMPSYFDVLGVPTHLAVNENELQKRFHEISKKIHPDRFAIKSPAEQSLAMKWATLLNRAYQTLKSRDLRINYLLSQNGISRTKNAKVPVELAESYFEMQDLLSEGGSAEPLLAFQKNLLELKENVEKDWEVLEKQWDASSDKKEIFQKASDLLNYEHYLSSMLEDMSEKIGAASADRRN